MPIPPLDRTYIQKTELEPLLGALGIAVTEAELKVVLASVDADGSGDVSFSEFYAWFSGGGLGGGGGGGDKDGLDDSISQLSGPSAASPGRQSAAGRKRGLRSAARTTFVKVCTYTVRNLPNANAYKCEMLLHSRLGACGARAEVGGVFRLTLSCSTGGTNCAESEKGAGRVGSLWFVSLLSLHQRAVRLVWS